MDITTDDLQFLLDRLDEGDVLVASSDFGLPTIHSIPNARHIGFGYFTAEVNGCQVEFEGGGALQRTPNGHGWCFLRQRGDGEGFAYDRDAAISELQARIEASLDQ